jgi:hypothetical protein
VANNKRHGLRLTLGGAPATPHTLAGFRGYYRPDVPTPVGRPGDVIEDIAEAKELAAKCADVVELVEIPQSQVQRAEAQAAADVEDGADGLAAARRDGRASDDTSRFADERDAVKKEESNA